ncbi:hypothetical protein FHS72_002434 [Loktanella ponticola]|uniref:Uncharacterized protein n=1 Tax=Yoonia ponticola TaxID=1524255 RepID=A0A7W9BMK8_9RHOB|nr:hypothetical protein [Yoonia ponticola]
MSCFGEMKLGGVAKKGVIFSGMMCLIGLWSQNIDPQKRAQRQ